MKECFSVMWGEGHQKSPVFTTPGSTAKCPFFLLSPIFIGPIYVGEAGGGQD